MHWGMWGLMGWRGINTRELQLFVLLALPIASTRRSCVANEVHIGGVPRFTCVHVALDIEAKVRLN
jgi:hypothetical protein